VKWNETRQIGAILHAFASRGFDSVSWAFLFKGRLVFNRGRITDNGPLSLSSFVGGSKGRWVMPPHSSTCSQLAPFWNPIPSPKLFIKVLWRWGLLATTDGVSEGAVEKSCGWQKQKWETSVVLLRGAIWLRSWMQASPTRRDRRWNTDAYEDPTPRWSWRL